MVPKDTSFSADVRLRLYAGGERFELGQLGPDFAFLRTPRTIQAETGEMETIIDGESSRWKVRFTGPITVSSRRFTFEAV